MVAVVCAVPAIGLMVGAAVGGGTSFCEKKGCAEAVSQICKPHVSITEIWCAGSARLLQQVDFIFLNSNVFLNTRACISTRATPR